MMWTKSLYNGVYFGKYTLPTQGEGGLSADEIWGKKQESL
jgi:hypothetical protein